MPPLKFEKLAEVYNCTPAELSYHPRDRERGKMVHAAILLARDLPIDKVQAWVAAGKAMAPAED